MRVVAGMKNQTPPCAHALLRKSADVKRVFMPSPQGSHGDERAHCTQAASKRLRGPGAAAPGVPLRKGDLGGWKPLRGMEPPHKKNPRFGQPRIRDIEEI
ncbi:hypothetical protein QJ48_10785 [Paenibacillus sp. A3]|nr:hypothetical protein QJ48_10785 [Paenibacillus sp. A3]